AMTRVVLRHPDPFVKITTAAIAAWIIGQALVNVAVVIGLLPVIGVPLPLVSAGGSALIMTMAAIGVVVAFARDEPEARAALAARPRTVRRSIAVVARGGARRLGRRRPGRASERTSSGPVPSVRPERVNRGWVRRPGRRGIRRPRQPAPRRRRRAAPPVPGRDAHGPRHPGGARGRARAPARLPARGGATGPAAASSGTRHARR